MQDRMTKFNSMITRLAEEAGFEVIVNPYPPFRSGFCTSDELDTRPFDSTISSGFDIQRPDSFESHIGVWVDDAFRFFLKCNNMIVVDADKVNEFWLDWAEGLNRFIAAYKACLLQPANPSKWDDSMAMMPILRWSGSTLVPGEMQNPDAYYDDYDDDTPADNGTVEALEEKSLDQILAEINDILEPTPAPTKGFKAGLLALIGR